MLIKLLNSVLLLAYWRIGNVKIKCKVFILFLLSLSHFIIENRIYIYIYMYGGVYLYVCECVYI